MHLPYPAGIRFALRSLKREIFRDQIIREILYRGYRNIMVLFMCNRVYNMIS